MKVLLTGANGFLGSHILDDLVECGGFDVSILLRRNADIAFIKRHLGDNVSVHYGSLDDRQALTAAVKDIEVVIHCAAKTKALRNRDYFAANREGTENLVAAVNEQSTTVRHFILISSAAVSGPGTADGPAQEDAAPSPVTVYGRSKLGAERALERLTDVRWTILRPSGVYGPRDRDFLPLFRMVNGGVVLLPRGGRQVVSVVLARDVARAVRLCLGRPEAAGRIYHVAAVPPSSIAQFAEAIAHAMSRRVRTVPVPNVMLYMACAWQELVSRVTRRPHILSLQKWPELSAPGWVCATDRIRDEIGFVAQTSLVDGLTETAAWYKREGWI